MGDEQYGPPAPRSLYGPWGRTGNSPTPRAPGQTQNNVTPQFDMNAMMAAFAQAQLQQQREYFQNQHRRLGMGGEDVSNQQGPYDSGGIDWLKGNRMSQDQQAAQFEGRPMMNPPTPQNPSTFGTQTQSSPFVMPPRNTFPDSTPQQPQAGLQENMRLAAPGGWRQPAPQAWAPGPNDFAYATSTKPKPKKPMGFGATGSQRPDSSFGF